MSNGTQRSTGSKHATRRICRWTMSSDEPTETPGGIDRRDLFKALGVGALGAAGFGGAAGSSLAQQQGIEIEYLFVTPQGGDEPQQQFPADPGTNADIVFGIELDVRDPPIAYQLVVVRVPQEGLPEVVGHAFDESTECFAGNLTADRGGQLERREGFSVVGLGPLTAEDAPLRYRVVLVVTNIATGNVALKTTDFQVGGQPAGNVTEGNVTGDNVTGDNVTADNVTVTDNATADNATAGNQSVTR